MYVGWYIFGSKSLEVGDWYLIEVKGSEDKAIEFMQRCTAYQYYKIEKIWSYPF